LCGCEWPQAGRKRRPGTKTWKRINGFLLLREGEGEVAELYVKKAMARFSKTVYDNWEKRVSHGA